MSEEQQNAGTTSDADPERKSDEEVLLGGEELMGFTIRPLPLAELVKILPELKAVKEKFAEEEVTLKNILEKWPNLLFDLLPHAQHVISVGAGMPMERAGALLPDQVALFLVKIVAHNWEYIKNSLGLGLSRYTVKPA